MGRCVCSGPPVVYFPYDKDFLIAPLTETAARPLDLGPHVTVFDPGMSVRHIKAVVDALAARQVPDEMGNGRHALLFLPGTYGSLDEPIVFQLGYYTEVIGLGQSPRDVVIYGHIDVYNQHLALGHVALNNFWRSISNLTINVTGGEPGRDGGEIWAVSQAAPLRRVDINGRLVLMDKSSKPGYSSGGFIADSRTGDVLSGSQQQFLTRNCVVGAWSNGLWNQVFVGVDGAPEQTFGAIVGIDDDGRPQFDNPYTVLPLTPVSREKPFLYVDSAHSDWRVFVPSPRRESAGPSWLATSTEGCGISLAEFFIAAPSHTPADINKALAAGQHLLLTPGVYDIDTSIEVDNPDTVVLGLGMATLCSRDGATVLIVADVPGVMVAGVMIDAGPVCSPVLVQVGRSRAARRDDSAAGVRADNPTALFDVFVRVGGPHPGRTTVALEVNSDHVLLDDIWVWRADHGVPGSFGWTVNTAETGLVVNGDHVTAIGLFVEHFQRYNVIWNGEHGTTIFFQNEMPYDAPDQQAWQHDGSPGWAAYKVADHVRHHELWGAGSYIYTNVDPTLHASCAFEAPLAPGVLLRNLVTVSLAAGTIDHIVNTSGPATTLDVRAKFLACFP